MIPNISACETLVSIIFSGCCDAYTTTWCGSNPTACSKTCDQTVFRFHSFYLCSSDSLKFVIKGMISLYHYPSLFVDGYFDPRLCARMQFNSFRHLGFRGYTVPLLIELLFVLYRQFSSTLRALSYYRDGGPVVLLQNPQSWFDGLDVLFAIITTQCHGCGEFIVVKIKAPNTWTAGYIS